jgi:hypothetical protein
VIKETICIATHGKKKNREKKKERKNNNVVSNEQEVLPPPDSVVLHISPSIKSNQSHRCIELNLEIGHSKRGKFFKTEIKKALFRGTKTEFFVLEKMKLIAASPPT